MCVYGCVSMCMCMHVTSVWHCVFSCVHKCSNIFLYADTSRYCWAELPVLGDQALLLFLYIGYTSGSPNTWLAERLPGLKENKRTQIPGIHAASNTHFVAVLRRESEHTGYEKFDAWGLHTVGTFYFYGINFTPFLAVQMQPNTIRREGRCL